jgi:hypothetical protein
MKLVCDCPAMKVYPVSNILKQTEEIESPISFGDPETLIWFGSLTWKQCFIDRIHPGVWLVRKITAEGDMAGCFAQITLEPELDLAFFALPVPASGAFSLPDGHKYQIAAGQKFPHAIALPIGGGVLEVQPVHAELEVIEVTI